MKDLVHFLSHDWRFRDIMAKVEVMAPGPERNRAVEDFWGFIYSGYYTSEVDLLRARARVLA
jgi:hypothetical protein